MTEIARSLDVPVATTELADRAGVFGTVSLSVLDAESERLVHGNELLAEVGVVGYGRGRAGTAERREPCEHKGERHPAA